MANKKGVEYIWWRNAEADCKQLRAVCRYLCGEVERLESQIELAQHDEYRADMYRAVSPDEVTHE